MGDYKAYTVDWAVKELDVPIDQMVSEYRLAKKQNAMINILAERCTTKPCRIAWILSRCGLEVDYRKLPRAQRNPEFNLDYVGYWESSKDAQICDEIRVRYEALEQEKKLEEERRLQKTDSEDVQETESVWTVIVEPKPVSETAENVTETAENVHVTGQAENKMGEIMTEAIDYMEGQRNQQPVLPKKEPVIEREPVGAGEILAEFWDVYMKHRRRGAITPDDVKCMLELEHIALGMVKRFE